MRGSKLFVVVGLLSSACIPPQQAGTAEAPASANANDAQPAMATAEPSPAPRASGPAVASFTLRNQCSKTVKLFYGKDPKFGSGRSSSIGGNSSQGEQMREGDMLWLTDDSGNGIANYSASANVHEVEISSSCTSLMAH